MPCQHQFTYTEQTTTLGTKDVCRRYAIYARCNICGLEVIDKTDYDHTYGGWEQKGENVFKRYCETCGYEQDYDD